MIVKTFCARMDHGGCGLLVHVEEGKIRKIEGDPDCPLNRGTICAKGIAQIERLDHPDRLLFPLKRTGKRGEGRWIRVSWDEALETIAQRLLETINRFGPESIAFAQGTPKGLELFLLMRLAHLLRIPNISTPGHICHMPRETASNLTCGFFPVPDYDHPPACVLVWGSNLFQTNEEGVIGSQLKRALERGAKLIVVDPRKTGMASRADLWIRPRPGADLFLALGMLKVIIEEGLYDRPFVDQWTKGFPELVEHLKQYSLEEIAETTWVNKEAIQQAARLYAQTRPASLQWGNAIEHTIHSFQCARALLILMAITGNLEAPGGNVNRPSPPLMRPGELVQIKRFPEKKEKILSPEYRLSTMMGFVPSQLIIKAILTEKPFPIRLMYIQGGNPLLSYANAQETFEALRRLDFLAVSEIFLTPTAQLADLVLPAATHFEFDDIGHYGLPHGFILARPKIVEPPGECWSDLKILNELGKKAGLGHHFWKDPEECLDEILRPAGLTYDDFKSMGMLKGDWPYRSYEKKGFSTPSKKVEIFSDQLKDWGYAPLPTPIDLPAPSSESFPLLLTSAKDPFYFHSAYRNIPSLRRLSPDPLLLIHPQTASTYKIGEGDWVEITTARGSIRQRAKFDADLDPRILVASYGWWFPERKDLELCGWKESNLNILTDNAPPYEPAIGSTPLRAIPCRISKAEPF
ncbi:MAG: molybdopterin-dependent oxidoreductase [Desulfobacterota bacterium]|nr:molybdopterin-dependent oxidoreductase [Thermodesulfobacteriota bacterium]